MFVRNAYQDSFVAPEQERILDLVEKEHANSLITANAVENDSFPEDSTADVEIGKSHR